MKLSYRGETEAKKVTRLFVWWQHQTFLKAAFRRTPHVFLASRIAGDIDVLRDMKVPKDSIWAVEKDPVQYRSLLRKNPESRVFAQNVAALIERYAASDRIRSVYLDYCGNLNGVAKTNQRVIYEMPKNSVVSITLFLGRERGLQESRETALLRQVRQATSHRVTLLQSIHYMSSDADTLGSMMGTWTFAIGGSPSRSKMRFDLVQTPLLEDDAAPVWKQSRSLALKRSRAAVQANITRQSA